MGPAVSGETDRRKLSQFLETSIQGFPYRVPFGYYLPNRSP